jgi:hypothetical protein
MGPNDMTDAELANEISKQGKVDMIHATTRTTLPAGWAALILYIANRYGLHWNLNDLQVFAPAILVVVPVFYRLARMVEAKFPKLAFLFFGWSAGKTPLFYASNK